MIQPVIGIDIAKDSFDVAVVIGDRTWNEQFENSLTGFKRLSRWVSQRTSRKVHACMESTGQYGEALAEYLYQEGWQISVVNPARIKAYGNSKLRRNKTDRADAQLIAEYCLRERPALWSPSPAHFKELKALVRRLEDLQTNYQQETNRLKAGGNHPGVIENIKEHIHYLEEAIDQIKKAIQEHIAACPELKQRQELLVSIPGIGELTAAKILGEIRDVCDFASARQLAAYAGVTPHNFLSGTSVRRKPRLSKTGNSNLRKALYMPAVNAKRFNPIIRAFCERLLSYGLRPMQVVSAAIHKLLHLIYGILKSGKPFDPNYLQKQGIAS